MTTRPANSNQPPQVVSIDAARRTGRKTAAKPAPTPPTAMVDGIAKRVVTLESLNKRFAILEAPGSPSIYVSRSDFLPIHDSDLRRRLTCEVVVTGQKDDRPVYMPAFSAWTGNASRHVYEHVVFTNRPVAADTFNLYRGLGVTPKPGKCALIIQHIEEVICAGDKQAAEAMIKLMAWQIQNIGQPSRVIVVLKSEAHQAGKGIILEQVLLKIYGRSGFATSETDKVLGRFNDALRGTAYIFLDEALFAGDRKSADALKSLSTATLYSIETKGLPIVQCPGAVNIWIASNHENAAYIEERDARYLVLNVSEHRVGDDAYFDALKDEIDNGGREAFADHLLNLDVSEFVPWRDIKKDTQAKREMIRESVNPYDARKWLEECCISERLIGRTGDSSGEWVRWEEGAEYPFGTLTAAYAEWQKTVRSRVGAKPTPPGRLGEVLADAGLIARRTKIDRLRILPDPQECLEKLGAREGDRPG